MFCLFSPNLFRLYFNFKCTYVYYIPNCNRFIKSALYHQMHYEVFHTLYTGGGWLLHSMDVTGWVVVGVHVFCEDFTSSFTHERSITLPTDMAQSLFIHGGNNIDGCFILYGSSMMDVWSFLLLLSLPFHWYYYWCIISRKQCHVISRGRWCNNHL